MGPPEYTRDMMHLWALDRFRPAFDSAAESSISLIHPTCVLCSNPKARNEPRRSMLRCFMGEHVRRSAPVGDAARLGGTSG